MTRPRSRAPKQLNGPVTLTVCRSVKTPMGEDRGRPHSPNEIGPTRSILFHFFFPYILYRNRVKKIPQFARRIRSDVFGDVLTGVYIYIYIHAFQCAYTIMMVYFGRKRTKRIGIKSLWTKKKFLEIIVTACSERDGRAESERRDATVVGFVRTRLRRSQRTRTRCFCCFTI